MTNKSLPYISFDINRPHTYYCALMPDRLPKRLDAARLARRAASLDLCFPVSVCERLMEALSSDAGTVTAGISLHYDEVDRCIIDGTANADVEMQCQRCLEPLTIGLHAGFSLAVVKDDGEADALPDTTAPLIAPDGMIDPQAMIEDELILVLPVVARHEDDQACNAVVESLKTDQEH